eukprot:jgi/Orpsp1_1/1192158/evm.model.d7180000090990.1
MTKLIQNVTIVGGGIIGSQIAYQIAYCGFHVTLLIKEEDEVELKAKLEKINKTYLTSLDEMKAGTLPNCQGIVPGNEKITEEKYNECKEQIKSVIPNMIITSNQKKACENADIIIEAIFENMDAKKELFQQLDKLMEEKTILLSNSSTFLPSQLAPFTGRPKKFLNFHFANRIYELNTVEVMGHSETDPNVFEMVVDFAKNINMVPLELLREQRGYILNTMLMPLLHSALVLWANGTCTPETCDKTWRISTATARGPFEIIDMIGLETVYKVYLINTQLNKNDTIRPIIAKKLKAIIDQGKLGICSGE